MKTFSILRSKLRFAKLRPVGDEVYQFIRCRIKDGSIPSEQKTINYLAEREGYKEETKYNIKGLSAFLEDGAERFPDVME